MAVDVLGLPPEVLHCIFTNVTPIDLARLSQCCHTVRDFLRNDWLLAKKVYLQHFVSDHSGMPPDSY